MQPTYDETFSWVHIVESAEECIKNVGWKQSVQAFTLNLYIHCVQLYNAVKERSYKSRGFTTFYITERGKTRKIQSVHITERVVQKCLCTYALKPIICPSLIYDNTASQKGKGQDFAIRRFREHLRRHIAKHGKHGGILIFDFHDFFGSIDHEILLSMLRKIIKDDELYEITAYFINCFPGTKGLGLGSEVSQICAIFYPSRIDHLIREEFGEGLSQRYMDDGYVICDDIGKLYRIRTAIEEVAAELQLEMNTKHTNIYNFEDDPTFVFLKCRTHIENTGKITMRLVRDNAKRRKRFIRKLGEMRNEGRIEYDYAAQSNRTWLSYAGKRKKSYRTIQSVKEYFSKFFGEEEMYEKEYIKTQKRINQKLFYIEEKVNKMIEAAKIDHRILKGIEEKTAGQRKLFRK